MSVANPDWYQNAFVYAIDVEAFQDTTGDGVGDFRGLVDRLDYLEELGVDCVWLLPFYPSPNRDNGYDVADYLGVDPRHGDLGDFVDVVEGAHDRGIRVLIDLVVNHTSDQHPWFRKAREGENPYRDYYVWSESEPESDPERGSVFPGEVEGDRIWTYDAAADAYYYHRFYPFQPDLNLQNPDVREEIRKIVQFWLRLGVDGFRVDAATLMIQEKRPGLPDPDDAYALLSELRSYTEGYDGDVVFMAEADDEPELLDRYAGADRMNLLLNFVLNAHLFSALATERGRDVEVGLDRIPALPGGGQWLNFLRNYDELNLGKLPDEDREATFERFAPSPDMRLYGRGIRRRLAPMLDGDPDRVELALSLLVSMPGSPLLVYGDEIGLGEELSLPARSAVRTPMQWSADENAGFSEAPADDLVRPIVSEDGFTPADVNVADQRGREGSLLEFTKHLMTIRGETPAIGIGELSLLETAPESVVAHRFDHDGMTVAFAHNLADEPVSVRLDVDVDAVSTPLGSGQVDSGDGTVDVALGPYGYQWLRSDA